MLKCNSKTAFLFAAAATIAAPASPAADTEKPPILDNAQMAEFGKLVGNAKTVIYGEDSHGMMKIHEMVPELFQYLVEKKGYRVFVFEVQWGVTEGLADFMASDRTEFGQQESYWLNGAFVSKPIAKMLVWIRDWNRKHPNDQIQLAGYQPEQPVTDFRGLFAYLDKAMPGQADALKKGVAVCRASDSKTFKTELDFIMANAKLNGQGKPAFTNEESAACIAGIDAIGKALDSDKDKKSRDGRFARLHQFSLASYYSNQRKFIDTYIQNMDAPVAVQRQWAADAYGRGDAARMVVYRELKDMRFPKAKVFHWMHNWHGFRHASEMDGLDGPGGGSIPRGTKSFGEHLSAIEKNKLRIIGTVVPCGTKCAEPENSFEPLYAQSFGASPAVVSFKKNELRGKLAVDQPKVFWANHHLYGFRDLVQSRQVDGMIYLPESEKVR